MNATSAQPSELICLARSGDQDALNVLVAAYRSYLKLICRIQQDHQLRSKLDDSDVVQEVSILAIRDFASFRGTTEAEFTAWLRVIMANVVAKTFRHYNQQRRDVRLEQAIQSRLDESSSKLETGVADHGPTPSQIANQRERSVLVAEAIENLPEHYREVIMLREFEGLCPKAVAERIGSTPAAVCKLWARAMVKVRDNLKGKL